MRWLASCGDTPTIAEVGATRSLAEANRNPVSGAAVLDYTAAGVLESSHSQARVHRGTGFTGDRLGDLFPVPGRDGVSAQTELHMS